MKQWLIIGYLSLAAILSVITFAAYGIDKYKAKKQQRTQSKSDNKEKKDKQPKETPMEMSHAL